jgi:hypothetical protein
MRVDGIERAFDDDALRGRKRREREVLAVGAGIADVFRVNGLRILKTDLENRRRSLYGRRHRLAYAGDSSGASFEALLG